ncbi:hypothetical protein DHEL01_v208735 [Diaporthe helianthi]|uniref:Uncharacterized protein n=1 Tax=Diaporthe helianthi TaxID=158607 RepID=A0A2P5HRK7_DIAHE|nr:hypothetical protein DHEL01_v208735 [Diaporthe helianthi]
MARYMGGPRCHLQTFRRRMTMLPPRQSVDTNMNQDDEDEGLEQTVVDEVPDSDDLSGSSQVSSPSVPSALSLADNRWFKVDDGDLLGQDQPTVLEGENGNSVAYNDEEDGCDSDSEPTTSGSGFDYPFPGLHGRTHTEHDVGYNEPRPKRQRSLSIPIYYKSPFSTGMLTLKPPPLPIAYGWMVRGTAEHVEDLHLTGVPFCSSKVHSKTKIEVLGEYTWIEVTPSQEETYERFPAIYVPGNARTWRPVQIDTSLHQEDVRSIIAQKIRDDNADRQPRYPYEPALRALESDDKVTSLSEIDIVTDADTLTQLLAFIMGNSSTRRVKEPFRLELKTVHNTLFIHPSHKPGSSQAGPPNKKTRHDPSASVPVWAAGVLAHIGTRGARLPYSGGHYRLVRYRFGSIVLAVRAKLDLVYEHRKDAPHAKTDPLSDVQPKFMPRQEGDVAQIWKTSVKKSGLGTKPAGAGIASVRYEWQDPKVTMRALLPQLWFSRTPFVVDCKVSYPDLSVKEVSIVNSRRWYSSYERGYQNSLRRLAGLLKHLQARTREMGGDIVLIADPVQVCFVLLKPVIQMQALPQDLVLKFWGPETEWEERERQAEMGRDSTPEEGQSDLTDLSSTPSLPSGSDIANVGVAQTDQSQPETPQPDKPQADIELATPPAHMPGGRLAGAKEQPADGIDPVQMVRNWNKSVDTPVRQSVEDSGTGYEAGDDSSPSFNAGESYDGNRSSSQGSVMVGESAQEVGVEGFDGFLNSLALQMNRPGVMQESHDNLTAVARVADVEVLRGQHSLLLADRHLTSGMHSSSDDEWPPRTPVHPHGRITNAVPDMTQPRHAHGDLELESIQSGSCGPAAATPPGPYDNDLNSEGHMVPRESVESGICSRAAATPPGPSDHDVDSTGHLVPRESRDRDDYEADSEDDNEEPAPPPRRREYLSRRKNVTARCRPRLSERLSHQQNNVVVSRDSGGDEEGELEEEEERAEIEEADDGDDGDEEDEL